MSLLLVVLPLMPVLPPVVTPPLVPLVLGSPDVPPVVVVAPLAPMLELPVVPVPDELVPELVLVVLLDVLPDGVEVSSIRLQPANAATTSTKPAAVQSAFVLMRSMRNPPE